MNNFVTPNDKGIIGESDSQSINNAVKEAIRSGKRRVLIPRINERTGKEQWDVDEAIILFSDIEIVLDNCYIRQIDGSMDNVFRNFDDNAVRTTLEEEQENIIIKGVGNAVIDGGLMNELTEATSRKNGLPHIEKNNVIRLHNLRGLKLLDFTILNQRWWAINLNYVEEALISGLKIICKPDCVNQDGIDLRSGCNNIILQNLYGQAGDDFIALTGFYGTRESKKYAVKGKSIDIHDVVIKNIVATSAECAVIALRNQDGVKLYNITIDTVHDTLSSKAIAEKDPSFHFNFEINAYKSPKSPYTTIRVGQDEYIHVKECTSGDVFGLHVTNIHTRTNTAILLNESVENSYFGNIYAGNDVDRVISTKSCRARQNYGAELKNVVFENIFYNCRDNENSTAFDFDTNNREHTIKNVFIRNAFIGNAACAVNMKHKGNIKIDNLCYDNADVKIDVCDGAEVIIDGNKII
jgi:hypothetical protein